MQEYVYATDMGLNLEELGQLLKLVKADKALGKNFKYVEHHKNLRMLKKIYKLEIIFYFYLRVYNWVQFW